MKKMIFCGLALAILSLPVAYAEDNNLGSNLTTSAEVNWGLKKLTGSGKIIEKETTLTKAYSTIEACKAVNVVIEDRTDNKVVIKADDNVMEYVVCKIESGKLIAKISDAIGSISNIDVNIYLPKNETIKKINTSSASNVTIYPTVRSSSLEISSSSAGGVKILSAEVEALDIAASSAANISGTYTVKGACDIDASSAARIDIELSAKEVECDASSSAKITLTGSAEQLEADASSASNIVANKFRATVADAEASSGADISVNATKRLSAQASSGADIRYTGSATDIRQSTSSGGSVKMM